MMINALRMILQLGERPLLVDANCATLAITTPYTAAILEYRVVLHEKDIEVHEETFEAKANGIVAHDVNHPCR